MLIKVSSTKSFQTERKATNIPTPEELNDAYLFQQKGPYKKTPDITLILGVDSDSEPYASILLCRFHKMSCDMRAKEKESLFMSVWDSMKASKFECRRTGGSSGLITDNKENVIKKFMSYAGSSPRCGRGGIWMRGKDTWFLYYMGTDDDEPTVKVCKYTNPVPGGSFRFHHKTIKKHKVLPEFISIKPISALIIESIKSRLTECHDFGDVSITPQAVAAELMNIAETQGVLECHMSGSMETLPLDLKKVSKQMKGSRWLLFYSIYNRDHVKFTLVLHPVGFHLDSFAQKCASLENKFCVEMLSVRIQQKMLINTHPHGRGGGSTPFHFVYGLLDWRSGQRNRRRVWTDPANAHLANAPNDENRRITREIWVAFWNPALVHVAEGIDPRTLPY